MIQLIARFYLKLPVSLRNKVFGSGIFKYIRQLLLRDNGKYKSGCVKIVKTYAGLVADFHFNAPALIAEKAKMRGLETTLLNSSIHIYNLLATDKKAIVLDIGCSFGFLSQVWATTICNKGGKVFAFEVHPDNLQYLRLSSGMNHLESIIQPVHAAVGDKNDTVTMYLSDISSYQKAISNSYHSIELKMITLDHWVNEENISRIDIVKIDVNGTEFNILSHATSLVDKYRPLCIIELNHDNRIFEFFHSKKYTCINTDGKKIQPGIDPHNIIAIPTEKYYLYDKSKL